MRHIALHSCHILLVCRRVSCCSDMDTIDAPALDKLRQLLKLKGSPDGDYWLVNVLLWWRDLDPIVPFAVTRLSVEPDVFSSTWTKR